MGCNDRLFCVNFVQPKKFEMDLISDKELLSWLIGALCSVSGALLAIIVWVFMGVIKKQKTTDIKFSSAIEKISDVLVELQISNAEYKTRVSNLEDFKRRIEPTVTYGK